MTNSLLDFINIDEYSKTPKYMQIVNSVIVGIEKGLLLADHKLPSVNMLLLEFDISRDTVVKAYDHLKTMEVIDSVPGKGYYVRNSDFKSPAKVLLVFNKLSQHKKIIYDAFVEKLGPEVPVDFYIYHNDFRLFKNLLQPRLKENYSSYVIIGHFLEGGQNAIDVINEIPKDKLIVLDKNLKGVTGQYASVYQDFESDILKTLEKASEQLQKYSSFKLVFPYYTYQPSEIISGFVKFCTEFAFDYEIIKDLENYQVEKDTAYLITMEDDLVTLIKKVKGAGFIAGEDVGIISYNETAIKEILLDGITTVSTDFKQLGTKAAELVLSGEKVHVKNPFSINFRNSL